MAGEILFLTVVNLIIIGYSLTTIGHANATGNWDTDDEPGSRMENWRRQRRMNILNMLLLDNALQRLRERCEIVVRRRRRRFWVRDLLKLREEQGYSANLVEEMRLQDHEMYFNYMRMNPQTFDDLLQRVGPAIDRQETNYRATIPAASRLSMTIRYLATGDSMASIAFAYRVSRSTVVNTVPRVCEAIWNALQDEMLQPSAARWSQVSQEFSDMWNFPHCIGALDGKHVVITAPPHAGSTFYNYKGQHSIVLMALASANYRFLMVDIGAQGRHSDGGVFRNSLMGQMFYGDDMDLPHPTQLSEEHPDEMPYMIIADEAFQLNKFTLRPYPGRNLTRQQRIFNYRLSRARRVVENAFGILVARWRIYARAMNTHLSTTVEIVKATICLHNYMMSKTRYCGPGYADHVDEQGQIVEGAWRLDQGGVLGHLGPAGSNAHSRYAASVRNNFMSYFVEEGAVPWQNDVA